MVSSCSYFDMSSIRFAYSMTDRTPPGLMLSLILIVLVGPYCVFYGCCEVFIHFTCNSPVLARQFTLMHCVHNSI